MTVAPSTPVESKANAPRRGPFHAVGTRTVWWFQYVTNVTTLMAYAAWRLTFGARHLRPVTRAVLVRQVLFTAVEALPFTGLIAVLLGASVIGEAQLHMAGNQEMMGKLLVVVVIRELGPLIAALILLLRSGTAMVVEMGNMSVTGEIRGLELAGIDPFEYLVIPRVFGMSVSLIAVTLYFLAFSVMTGVAVNTLMDGDISHTTDLINSLTRQLGWIDVAAFAAKTVVPGLMVAAIVCYEGLGAGPAVTDVPRAATRGTVRAVVALFVWNVSVSVGLYLL